MYRDMNPELTAWESGLDRFIALDKGDFIGRDTLIRQRDGGIARRLVTIRVESQGASVLANESVYHQGRLVGRVTSGGFAHTLGHDVALALLPADLTVPATELEVNILGKKHEARVIPDSPYDPEARRSRL